VVAGIAGAAGSALAGVVRGFGAGCDGRNGGGIFGGSGFDFAGSAVLLSADTTGAAVVGAADGSLSRFAPSVFAVGAAGRGGKLMRTVSRRAAEEPGALPGGRGGNVIRTVSFLGSFTSAMCGSAVLVGAVCGQLFV
jgi:hypothetical protein